MSEALRFLNYQFQEHDEHVVANLPAKPTSNIIMIPPLFGEMNKIRSILIDVARQLSDRNISCLIPDLPGTNESKAAFNTQNLSLWRDAIAQCAQQHQATHIASFRSGCLIDNIGSQYHHWRLNPTKGASIIKTMLRSKLLSLKESGQHVTSDMLSEQASQSGIELAGYYINADMFIQMQQAVPAEIDQLIENKLGDTIKGVAIWLKSEPDYDAELAESITKSLMKWCTL